MPRLKLNTTNFLIFLGLIFIVYLQGILNIPALDRDESRFASASKNMLQTGDYIDIKIKDEPRYKKPIGIYWFQSISNKIFGKPPYDKIWVYRLPSLAGIFTGIILFFFVTRKLFKEKVAFTSSLFLAFSFLIITEINQAKSDGLLFLFITICNLIVLLVLEDLNDVKKNLKTRYYLKPLFWASLAFGTLTKGPVIFIFVIIPIFVFSIIKKTFILFKYLHSFTGYLVYVFIVVPWFVLITIKSGKFFWYESVVNDLFRKVSSGQESHGFPPGYYSFLLIIFLWPACTFLFGTLREILNHRKEIIQSDLKRLFLICWFLPPFIIYELIPTKLPHYVLPSYPALCLMISLFLDKETKNLSDNLNIKNLFIYLLFPLTTVCIFLVSTNMYSKINSLDVLLVLFLLTIILISGYFFVKKNHMKLIIFSSLFQISMYLTIVYDLNYSLKTLWISKNLSDIVSSEIKNIDHVYDYGFNEPSLIFSIGHKSERITPEVMSLKAKNSKRNLFILNKDNFNDFLNKEFDSYGVELIHEFRGFNYSQGRYMTLIVFKN